MSPKDMEHNTKWSCRSCIYLEKKKVTRAVGTSANSCLQNSRDENKMREGRTRSLMLEEHVENQCTGKKGVLIQLESWQPHLKNLLGKIQGDRNTLDSNSPGIWSLESSFGGFKITWGCYKIKMTRNTMRNF